MLKVPFYFFKSLVKRVLHDFKTEFCHFLTLTPPITTQHSLNPRENVLSHILTLIQSLWTPDMIRLSSITLFWGKLSVLQTKLTPKNPLLTNISSLCTQNMSVGVILHEKPERGDDRYDSSVCILRLCNWPTSVNFNPTHCNMIFRSILTSKSIQRTPDHVLGIPVHLFITLDRLNTSNSEYPSRPCLGLV